MTVSDGRKPGFGKKESGQAGPTKTNVASHKNFVIKNASQGMARGVDTGSNEVGLYDPDKEHEFRPPPWETLMCETSTGVSIKAKMADKAGNVSRCHLCIASNYNFRMQNKGGF